MPRLNFTIASQHHSLDCAEGEEEHILSLVKGLNERVSALSKTFGGASDNTIIAITAIMMEDEIKSLKEGKNILVLEDADSAQNAANQNEIIDEAVAEALEPVVQAIEILANKAEQ